MDTPNKPNANNVPNRIPTINTANHSSQVGIFLSSYQSFIIAPFCVEYITIIMENPQLRGIFN